jgi:hypothetical protein
MHVSVMARVNEIFRITCTRFVMESGMVAAFHFFVTQSPGWPPRAAFARRIRAPHSRDRIRAPHSRDRIRVTAFARPHSRDRIRATAFA